MVTGNTQFKQHPRRLITRRSSGKKNFNQINYIFINTRFRYILITTKTMPGDDCSSEHVVTGGKVIIGKKETRKVDIINE